MQPKSSDFACKNRDCLTLVVRQSLFCGDVVLRRGDGPQEGGVPLRGGGLAFQDFEGGAGGGAEHVDAGSQTFKRFCGLDSGAERDAVN